MICLYNKIIYWYFSQCWEAELTKCDFQEISYDSTEGKNFEKLKKEQGFDLNLTHSLVKEFIFRWFLQKIHWNNYCLEEDQMLFEDPSLQ